VQKKVCCKPLKKWKPQPINSFLDTFNKVRENFQRVFKALFTEEDTADLILENPDNLAETSIDICCKT
jgi:chromosome segregation ATPase